MKKIVLLIITLIAFGSCVQKIAPTSNPEPIDYSYKIEENRVFDSLYLNMPVSEFRKAIRRIRFTSNKSKNIVKIPIAGVDFNYLWVFNKDSLLDEIFFFNDFKCHPNIIDYKKKKLSEEEILFNKIVDQFRDKYGNPDLEDHHIYKTPGIVPYIRMKTIWFREYKAIEINLSSYYRSVPRDKRTSFYRVEYTIKVRIMTAEKGQLENNRRLEYERERKMIDSLVQESKKEDQKIEEKRQSFADEL